MDPQGNFVYVGFRNSNLASYRIDRNSGALKVNEIANLLPGATANAVRTDASGRFVYVADSTNSGLYGFVVNRRTGGFTATIGSPFSSGLGPSVLSTSNNFLYVYNNAQSADIAAYWISPNSGVLTAVPGSPFTGKNYPAHYIAVDSAHNVLYQPAFGPSSSTISVYTVEPSTGVITFKGFTAQYQEIRAETLLPDFSGKYLYLVGAYDGTERSDVAVSSFTIDPATGNLALATGPLRVASPNHYSSLAVSP